jgi:hypothetical protein
LTTGTAGAIIYDRSSVAGDVNAIVVGPGEPTDCGAIVDDLNSSLQGVLVNTFPTLDVEEGGDIATGLKLVLE